MRSDSRTISYLLLLLALGANTLIVELVIPRLIAPVFGNTLFSWTAIISVVLLMLTLGYRVGGFLAARVDARRWIFIFSIGAALWVLVLSLVGDLAVQRLDGLNLMLGPLVAALLLAAVPAFLDAAVIPLAIQLIPGVPGEVSGRCFAWSTVGSILGVLLTGYVLLPQFGISGALLTGVLAIAVAMAVLGWFAPAGAVAALSLVVLVAAGRSPGDALVDLSNGYHRIRVAESGAIRSLYLDNTLEGQVRMGSDYPVAGYMITLAEHLRRNLVETHRPIDSVFFIGGGSFSLPRYLKALRPSMHVHASEIDPDVVETGRQYLELGNDFEISIGDGRTVLKQDDRRYDLIVNDAFQGLRKIPFHLVSRQFNELVATRLTSRGIYMANVRGDPSTSRLASSFVRTLSGSFEHVYTQTASAHNVWVIGSKQPLDWAQPAPRTRRDAQLLTDNHAPVEYLIVRDIVDERLARMARD